mmetsp:Transcript_100112/g.180609  ORF Transcript_100112/g.180609 Transcript_100112/m.180609 type:complete len:84 (+) Transcript_100112:877-1128(+)
MQDGLPEQVAMGRHVGGTSAPLVPSWMGTATHLGAPEVGRKSLELCICCKSPASVSECDECALATRRTCPNAADPVAAVAQRW